VTARIDFAGRFGAPETFAVCVLIEGVPIVLTPAGLLPTSTAITAGTLDPLWWPGVGALTYAVPGASAVVPVRDWLDPGSVWEIYRQVRPLEGDQRGEALTFEVHDPDGAATAMLSGPRARQAQILTASVSDAATSIPVDSTTGVPSSGIAWLGREAIVYDGVGGSALLLGAPPARRGAFGARARAHRYDSTSPLLVTFGAWPRHLYGRLATVWLCRVDGSALTDPTLIYAGTIGPGVQRAGLRWSIPVDPLSEVLSRKLPGRRVSLFGYAHPVGGYSTYNPLYVNGQGLDGRTGAPHDGGWHRDRDEFLTKLRLLFVATPTTIGALSGNARPSVRDSSGGGPLQIQAAWHDPTSFEIARDAGVAAWASGQAMPAACLHLHGQVFLPTPGDASSIPALSVNGASFALIADTRHTKGLVAQVVQIDAGATPPWVSVIARLDAYESGARDPSPIQHASLITERTDASIGVVSSGDPATALRDAGTLLDAIDGGLHGDLIDWEAIGRVFAATPLGTLPEQREYTLVPGKDTIVSLLVHECRLRALALCTRNGRLSVYRTAVFASTEETTAVVTDADQIAGIEPEVIDAQSPVATSVTFHLRGGGSVRWVDETSRSEFGDGADVQCRALSHVPFGLAGSTIEAAIQTSAQQVLGVLAEPYRTVRLTLGPRFLGIQDGDLVSLTHPRLPTLSGTLGVAGVVAQVQETRMQVLGGSARAVVAVRLQEPDLAGYAPELLVAAGGLAVAGATTVVTVDASTPFGATCFARRARPDGTAATSATDGLTVGDRVALSQCNARAPIADELATITALTDTTVTLDVAASGPMVTAAATQYGCILRFADWVTIDVLAAVVRDRQERYLFVADDATGDLGAGDAPKRWAA
jgi:hypothetical protein